jgi:hypothetical protein
MRGVAQGARDTVDGSGETFELEKYTDWGLVEIDG